MALTSSVESPSMLMVTEYFEYSVSFNSHLYTGINVYVS